MNSSSERELCKFFQTSHGCKFTADKCKKLHLSKEQICKFHQTPNGCRFTSEQCKFAHVKIETSTFRNPTSSSNLQERDETISMKKSDFEALIATSVKSQFEKMKIESSGNNLLIKECSTPKFNDVAPMRNLMDIQTKRPLLVSPPPCDSSRDSRRTKQKTKPIAKTDENKQEVKDINKVSSASKTKFKSKDKKECKNTCVVSQAIASECTSSDQFKKNDISKKKKTKKSDTTQNSLSKKINFYNWQIHRENEMQALRIRYPSCKEIQYRKGVFIHFDFQFSKICIADIKSFPMKLIFPSEYPLREMIKVDLMLKPDSDSTLRIIERSIEFWLTQKLHNLKKLKRAELIVEPLLKWVDLSLPYLIAEYLQEGNFYTDTSSRVSLLYKTQVKQVLLNDFPMFRKGDLDILLAKHNNHYAPSHKAVMDGLEASGLRITDDKKLVGKNSNLKGLINFIPVLIPNEGNVSLHISNIPENANVAELKSHFQNAGIKVKQIRKPSGKQPFVFMDLQNKEDFDAAMNLSGSNFKGSRIRVNIAKYGEANSARNETPSISFTVSPDCVSVETVKFLISTWGITIKDVIKSPENNVYTVNLTKHDDTEMMKTCLQNIFTKTKTAINFIDTNTKDEDDDDDADEVSYVVMRIHVLRKPSKIEEIEGEIESRLKKEIDFVSRIMQEFKNQDIIECDCCFEEFSIPDMICCTNGHLFCTNCLQSYTNESVFGQGKAELKCMTECDGYFLKNQLEKGLPADLLEKYEDRVRDESINMANLENLVKCPNCNYAVLLEGDFPVFPCQNCQKVLCKYCLSEWDNKKANHHFSGLCVKKEDASETLLRKSYEEKMTEVCIRTCPQCKTQFLKEEGCNKVVCKCGLNMCYVCRSVITDYKHFCQHVRDPGEKCKECSKCFLFEDMKKKEEKKIIELKKEAEQNRKVKGEKEFKPIGVLTTNEKQIKEEDVKTIEARISRNLELERKRLEEDFNRRIEEENRKFLEEKRKRLEIEEKNRVFIEQSLKEEAIRISNAEPRAKSINTNEQRPDKSSNERHSTRSREILEARWFDSQIQEFTQYPAYGRVAPSAPQSGSAVNLFMPPMPPPNYYPPISHHGYEKKKECVIC